METLVIGDRATCLAFSLGGIATRRVKNRTQASEALRFAVHSEEIGLVMITEKVAALIRSEVDTIVYSRHRPLVVEIPDTSGPLPGRPSAGELMISLMKH